MSDEKKRIDESTFDLLTSQAGWGLRRGLIDQMKSKCVVEAPLRAVTSRGFVSCSGRIRRKTER